jgi:hypothetical protein
MFIESLSFAGSATAGIVAAKAGAAALACLAAATPAGWVLIIAGITVVGLTASASIVVNKTARERGGAIYDSIMKSLVTL